MIRFNGDGRKETRKISFIYYVLCDILVLKELNGKLERKQGACVLLT